LDSIGYDGAGRRKMRNPIFITAFLLLACAELAWAGGPACFPGAVGFGVDTRAGRGGRVIAVTHLQDHGPGSLREALENATGPRTVVFEVAGYIDLQQRLVVKHPFVTIAGQTAPSPGVTVRYNTFRIATHDVLLQHLRVRVGGRDYRGQAPDGLQVIGEADSVYNVVVDHCSISWAIDENVGFATSGSHDVTISNCIIAEGLRRSSHMRGGTSMGALVPEHNQRLAFIGNLFAHNNIRNPKWSGDCTGVVANNLIYDVQNVPDLQPRPPTGPSLLSIVGNHVVPGHTLTRVATRAFINQPGAAPGTRVYVKDNVCDGCTGRWQDDVVEYRGGSPGVQADAPPVWPEGFVAMPGSQTMESVLASAGARPWDRDAADARVVQSVRDRSGGVIDCVTGETLFRLRGVVASASDSAVVLRRGPETSDVATAYQEYEIRIEEGPGRGQSRRIVRYLPDALTCYVAPPWFRAPERPEAGSLFAIVQSCSLNAGGWPPLTEAKRPLHWPGDHAEILASGYTRLEEWLRSFEW